MRWSEALDPATVAAVLLEPLQGEGGVVVPSSDYLAAVQALCTERDVLLMLDEVQTGLGRTGHWFAFQAQGLRPDVVTMAKALGNGMPVGACWARAEVAAAFGPGDHGSTFGGQPLALSAARATLSVMEAEDVCGRAREKGLRLAAGLRALPGVVSVRGAGLLLAAQLRGTRGAGGRRRRSGPRPARQCRAAGCRASRSTASRDDDEIDQALAILNKSLESLPVPRAAAERRLHRTDADPRSDRRRRQDDTNAGQMKTVPNLLDIDHLSPWSGTG